MNDTVSSASADVCLNIGITEEHCIFEREFQSLVSMLPLHAAVSDSSAACDLATEKLRCFLDPHD